MKKQEENREEHHHSHAMLDVGAVGGAIVGTTVGMIAGPVGMAVGAAVGSALGAVTGNALDQEDERHLLHEHELDREIGVEGGDIGRPSAPRPRRKK